jgi:enoyl-CoA hydratase/carnithine racemase
VITAIKGAAVGVGLQLALCADIRSVAPMRRLGCTRSMGSGPGFGRYAAAADAGRH